VLAPLLTTRLHFPANRHNLAACPRLVERLKDGLSGPLTLISAPTGYGKTTLLSEWRSSTGKNMPAGWFSLDAADNDPVRFIHYLVAALKTINQVLV